MIMSNIVLGKNVIIDSSSSINNVIIGDNVKIAKNCSIFGSSKYPLVIGEGTYIGMNTLINGYHAQIKIGDRVSVASNVIVMADSGPNASSRLQQIYPIQKGEVIIGNDCWLGVGVIIMPGVNIAEMCVVAANSFVNCNFDAYSVIGGTPAKLLKKINVNS